jgi:peptide deformylase
MPPDPASLRIVLYPAEVLTRKADPVAEVDDHVRAVAERMIELMHEARGVGLAAPQVGLPWRMFVTDTTGEGQSGKVYINPELFDPTPQTAPRDEGCLSLPQITGEITRPVGISIRGLNEQGQPIEERSEEFPARVWQHEFDHLDGTLILDKMTRMDRMANKRLIRDLESR